MPKVRYSLNDRIDYYNDLYIRELNKYGGHTFVSDFAQGYIAGSDPTVDLVGYRKYSKNFKRGLVAGRKARARSENIKF